MCAHYRLDRDLGGFNDSWICDVDRVAYLHQHARGMNRASRKSKNPPKSRSRQCVNTALHFGATPKHENRIFVVFLRRQA